MFPNAFAAKFGVSASKHFDSFRKINRLQNIRLFNRSPLPRSCKAELGRSNQPIGVKHLIFKGLLGGSHLQNTKSTSSPFADPRPLLATARAHDRIWLDESWCLRKDLTQYSIDKPIDW